VGIEARLRATVLGRVATWVSQLPSPRFSARWVLREAAGKHAAMSVSDDVVDLHVLPMRLPGQAASFRSLLRRLLTGRTPRIPSARFVTMPGGHFPWYDDPDQCASLVAQGL
jgi:pimeloyl-ACP methyl ester carboxylesterase